MHSACMCTTLCRWKSEENFWKSWPPSFQHMGPGDPTQAVSLGSRRLHPLIDFATPSEVLYILVLFSIQREIHSNEIKTVLLLWGMSFFCRVGSSPLSLLLSGPVTLKACILTKIFFSNNSQFSMDLPKLYIQ